MNLRRLSCGACAALLFTAMPAVAAAPGGAVAATASPAAAAVGAFYDRYRGTSIWLRKTQNAAPEQLISILRRAPIDGLAVGPRLAAEAETAVARARTGDPAAAREAERLLSTAWVLYVQALQTPPAGMTYADSRLAPRPLTPDQILARAHAAASSAQLAQHLKAVSDVNPIYAELRQAALNQIPLGGGAAFDPRILANLERARVFPMTGRYIVVDTASQRLLMVDDGEIRDSMKVVVGKTSSPTPVLASTIHWATLNPYWNIPADLTQKLIAPHVLEKGPNYLGANGYQLVSSFDEGAEVLPADSVDWKAVADGSESVYVRQLPGGSNAMGKVKFSFPNSGGIYLHDTPDRHLFAKSQRTFSNGCVRLEDASRLARWLAGRELVAPSDAPEQLVQLPRGVPVYLTYLTVKAEDGRLAFVDDVYGRDPSRLAETGSGAIAAR